MSTEDEVKDEKTTEKTTETKVENKKPQTIEEITSEFLANQPVLYPIPGSLCGTTKKPRKPTKRIFLLTG